MIEAIIHWCDRADDVHNRRVYRRLASVDTTFYVRGLGGTTLAVYDGSGDLMYWNILGAGEIVGRAVVETSSTDRQYYVKDHLGSIRGTINEGGSVDHQSDYYPFGLEMPSRVWTVDPTRERYTGHEIEELGSNTTWYYAGARMYDPVVARWMTTDPLAEKFPGWSPYNYVLGNPVKLADPTGLCPPVESCIAALATVSDNALKRAGLGPTERTVAFDMPLEFVAAAVANTRRRAEGVAAELGKALGSRTLHNDRADAFRHAYFSALNTRHGGEEFAQRIGDAHEADGFPDEVQIAMDSHNNRIGIDLALDMPRASSGELVDALLMRMRDGNLMVIEGGRLTPSSLTDKELERAGASIQQQVNYQEIYK